jgi:hypothetical protein
MAWPFDFATFNLDTGLVAVPTGAASIVTGAACWIVGASFTCGAATGDTITVTITNSADVVIACVEVVPGAPPPSMPWTLKPSTGIKWTASASGVIGHIWGYF